MLRNLSDSTDRKFDGVTEYTLTKDAKLLVYASETDSDTSGVYVVKPGDSAAPAALLAGKGRYSKPFLGSGTDPAGFSEHQGL